MRSWVVSLALVVSASAMTSAHAVASLPADRASNVPTTCDQALTPTNAITLEVTPKAIYEQLTKHLSVTCSLHQGQGSEFTSVMSIILSKASVKNDIETFRDVAVLTSHRPNTPEVKDGDLDDLGDLEGQVTGNLSGGEAFLSIQWRYPTRHTVGKYRCVAYGIDGNGRPVVSEGYATVAQEEGIADILVKRLKSIESRLDSMRDKIFEKSSAVFNGKVYLLSRLIPTNMEKADYTCRLFGGYLAEIRTKAQHDFVYDFLVTQGNLSKGQVLLGATDEQTEGIWTYVYSKDRVTYTDWKDGADGGRGSNCMMFTGIWINGRTFNGMTDDPCNGGYLVRFLCEVQEL